jgi:hypothetical protein
MSHFSTDWNLRAGFLDATTLVVCDPGQNLATWITTSGQVLRSRPISEALAYLPIGDNGIAYARHTRTPDLIGLPLHVQSGNGSVRSFGAVDSIPVLPQTDNHFQRLLAPGGSDWFWAHKMNEYAADAWTITGVNLRHIARDAPWFPSEPLRGPNPGPQPWFFSMRQDSAGYVRTLVAVPDPNAATVPNAPNRSYTVAEEHQRYNTVIEFMQPGGTRAVSRVIIDELLGGFATSDIAWSVRETAPGAIEILIWRVSLVQDRSLTSPKGAPT